MTHLPKAELVGVLAPYSINSRDVGMNWKDLGVIPSPAAGILSLAYLGNGIVIAGADNKVFKSVDYGITWTDQGAVGASSTSFLSYFGNGIVILIDGALGNQIFRSTDFGSTWISLGLFGAVVLADPIYLGNNIGLIGSAVSGAGGHIWYSSNNGATWADLGAISVGGTFAGNIFTLQYLENGIAIFGDSNGRIWRSTNFGAAWTSFVSVSGSTVNGLIYIGRGIVLAGDGNAHIFRSIDYGVTWSDLGQIGATPAVGIGAFAYFGNGIIVAQHTNLAPGSTFTSMDYGLTWPGGSFSTSNIQTTSYLGNGIGIFGDGTGHIFRSDIAYKLDESQVLLERPVTIVNADITVGQSHDTIIVDSPGVNRIITLQDAQLPGMTGHEFTIVNIAINCIVTIATVNNRTINGALNPTLDVQWQSMTVKSNGVNWNIT